MKTSKSKLKVISNGGQDKMKLILIDPLVYERIKHLDFSRWALTVDIHVYKEH